MPIFFTRFTSIVTLLFLITSSSVLYAQQQQPIQISTFNTPFSIVMKEVMREAYKRIGLQTNIIHLPGARALKSSSVGAVDAELYRIAAIEKIHPDLIRIPVVIYDFEVRAFSKSVDFKPNSWQSLRPYKIGIINGVKITNKNTLNIQREIVNNLQHMFELLVSGRIDLALTTSVAGRITQKELKLSDVKMLSPAVYSFPVYHFVHKKKQRLVPLLTNVLQQMKTQGEIKKIIDQQLTILFDNIK